MFKFGIWRAQGLRHPKTIFGTYKPISYSLLRVPQQPAPEDIDRFEHVIKGVRLSFGIWRTTYPSRFDDIDAAVQECLTRYFDDSYPLKLHDGAASDCQLSERWGALVRQRFPQSRVTASDLMLYVVEARSDSGEIVILEPTGQPIQYTRPPFVVNLGVAESRYYPINRLVQRSAKSKADDASVIASAVTWNGVPDEKTVRSGQWTLRQLPLVHPRVLTEVRNGRMDVRQQDAFAPSPLRFDAVRFMNLFQPHVFSREKIRALIQVALDSLNDGGLLIVGRTMEFEGQRNDVSIYRKTERGVEHLHKLGKGFEFYELPLEYEVGAA